MITFKAFDASRVPRHWGLYGMAGIGKSTFANQMRGKLLVLDVDGRWSEQARRQSGKSLSFSDDPQILRDPLQIKRMFDQADLSGIGTIVLDSISPITDSLKAEAMEATERGEFKNKASAHITKANRFTLLQDSVIRGDLDACVIWHLKHGRDEHGKEVDKQSLGEVDRGKLLRSLNAVIRLEARDGKRVAVVVWDRNHRNRRDAVVIPDDLGYWKGVPERIDEALEAAPAVSATGPVRAASR